MATGDIDGDGIDDVIIGDASYYDSSAKTTLGPVQVVYGWAAMGGPTIHLGAPHGAEGPSRTTRREE